MPIVEFVGPSGVGKSTLVELLLRQEKLHRWKNYQNFVLTQTENLDLRKHELHGTHKLIWDRKFAGNNVTNQNLNQPSSEATYLMELLQHDQLLQSTTEKPFILLEENVLQNFLEEHYWIAKHHRNKCLSYLSGRAFILITDHPHNISKRFRQRKLSGVERPWLDERDEEPLQLQFREHQSALLNFLQHNEDLGYNWFAIDMALGTDQALIKASAFLRGLENIHDADARCL
jgi:hypothetical protein